MRRRLNRSVVSPVPTRPTATRSHGQAAFNADGNTAPAVNNGDATRGTVDVTGSLVATIGAISGLGVATAVGSIVTLTAGGLVRPSMAGDAGRTSVKTAATA